MNAAAAIPIAYGVVVTEPLLGGRTLNFRYSCARGDRVARRCARAGGLAQSMSPLFLKGKLFDYDELLGRNTLLARRI